MSLEEERRCKEELMVRTFRKIWHKKDEVTHNYRFAIEFK